MNNDNFFAELTAITGKQNVITKVQAKKFYCKGFRFGNGMAQAVVIPHNLLELWRVINLCHQANRIIIMQAANTSLTGGSTPAGSDYDRPVVVISITKIKGIHILGAGEQIIALPGTSLTELEASLQPYQREPHSVIGSSCIGASVIGGVCNNSGGSLVRRGPSFTEMALFARINAAGAVELINNLGIELGANPEQILTNLTTGNFNTVIDPSSTKRTWADDYAEKIRDIEAATPARYNADPSYWHEASGCSGKVIVFAVRLSSFAKANNPHVFYIGANSEQALIKLRRAFLSQLTKLPIAAEYMDRNCFNLTARFGKSIYLAIKYFGEKSMPSFNKYKNKIDSLFHYLPLLSNNGADKLTDLICRLLPRHLPKRLYQYRDKFQHHLMLKVEQDQIAEVKQILTQELTTQEDYFICNANESKAAFLHRFAAGGGPGMYCHVNNKKNALLSFDLALRRNDPQWQLQLPAELADKLELQATCGHFLCSVMHQYYILKDGVDAAEFKQQVLKYLDSRGAKYPAEHNLGHLYHADAAHKNFYQQLDPTNSLNPGIGLTSKKKYWQD